MLRSRLLSAIAVLAALPLPAQDGALASAPVRDVRYEVAFTRADARQRLLRVTTRFEVAGPAPVALSLPAWTPGAYELAFFARHVRDFAPTMDGRPLAWDKVDADTWRIRPEGAGTVTVSFAYRADSLDNAMAWARDDFAFFNGTTLFLYPEGSDLAFGAQVTVRADSGWRVVTAMPADGRGGYVARSYHDAVDAPFFVGAFDVDSQQVGGRWMRLASYPATALAGDDRRTLWAQVARMMPPMIAVTGAPPEEGYTILTVFDSSSSGGSALEHGNSHLGIYTPFIIGDPAFPSITAHEIFHLWNVKRMRPTDLVPYRYDRAMPTPWLWVSEGITDYYADLALLRGGIVDSAGFLATTAGKADEVAAAPPVALEDASLSTWIQPGDGTGLLYYPKGSLAGFLLDILVRDASDNASGLDDVMRAVYAATVPGGRGFTPDDWWGAVSRAAGGRVFTDFRDRYIDGREPFPYDRVLPLAGLRLQVDSLREPRLGVFTAIDSTGAVIVTDVEPGSAADGAGVRAGDALRRVGDVAVEAGFAGRFRARYAAGEGTTIPLVVTRDGHDLTLPMVVQVRVSTRRRLVPDPAAPPRAQRVRHGLFTGTTRR